MSDAGIVADCVGEVADVGTYSGAHLGYGVDERDAGGQIGVRGGLDHLGGALSAPTTMRSGVRVSATAVPSRRNSGFQATSICPAAGARLRARVSSFAAVPGVTVDLPTIRRLV
ncbi:hypothetical protein O7543_07225 [Solwaraspora sp. WMMA2080]|uniref:hypothetical protein n=1 Tax=Solwaraspora sp. WMMA2080 TaxID=3015165 RepID=UPI00248ACFEC|nr:hypothetical protein [Solwaraspora sp. WMMA2080]WBC24064.1 hypothetical protein O7543_07225 [Solwaraspora sp. WMMA2080]